MSPDQLEEIIKSESKWEVGTYNVLKHNCHQFVMYCLDKIGAGYFFKGYIVFLKLLINFFKNLFFLSLKNASSFLNNLNE